MSSFIGDLLRVSLSRVGIIFFGLVTSIITARYLGPEKNGIIAGLLVYPSLFMSIAAMGIRQSTTYFLGKGIYTEQKIKTAITQIWFFTSLFSTIVSFLLIYFFSTQYNNFWVLLALVPIPFTLFVTYSSGIFLGKNQIREFNKVNWLPQFITMLLSIIFIIFIGMEISGAMIAMIGGPLIMFVIMIFKNDFLKSFNFRFEWSVIRSMLSLGVTYAIALLIINLNYRIDIILLDKLSTAFEVGIYSKGAAITQYLWQIPMVLGTIVFSRSTTSKNDIEFSKKVSQLLRLSLIAVSLMSVFLICFSKFIILLMYGKEFSGSVEVLKILLPGVVILTLFKVMNMDLAGKGKPWISMKAMIPALVVNILLNVILIPKYGAIAASFSSTISYGLAGVLFLYYYSKALSIPIREIIFYKKTDFAIFFKFLKKK